MWDKWFWEPACTCVCFIHRRLSCEQDRSRCIVTLTLWFHDWLIQTVLQRYNLISSLIPPFSLFSTQGNCCSRGSHTGRSHSDSSALTAAVTMATRVPKTIHKVVILTLTEMSPSRETTKPFPHLKSGLSHHNVTPQDGGSNKLFHPTLYNPNNVSASL